MEKLLDVNFLLFDIFLVIFIIGLFKTSLKCENENECIKNFKTLGWYSYPDQRQHSLQHVL